MGGSLSLFTGPRTKGPELNPPSSFFLNGNSVYPHQQAVEDMQQAAQFFHQRGWLLGTCGNLSVLLEPNPRRILVTPSGRDKSRLQADDFLLVDETGQVVEGNARASEELTVHQAIYNGTTARAVYHVHSVPNNLASHIWGQQGQVTIEGIEMIKGLAGKRLDDVVHLPIVANSQEMQILAENVARGLSSGVPAVLVHQHGIYAWGETPDAARRHIEILEFLLEVLVRKAELRGVA